MIKKHQINRAEEAHRKILCALSAEWTRFRDIVIKTGLGATMVSRSLKFLVRTGLVERKLDVESGEYPYPVYYKLTQKGLDAQKTLQRQEIVEKTKCFDVANFIKDKVSKRVEKTLEYMAPQLEAKLGGFTPKLKAALTMYATAASLDFFKPTLREASEKLNKFTDALVRGLEVAVDPHIETAEEGDSVAIAVLDLLNHVFQSQTYRQKVANTGKFAIIIILDLSKLDMSPDDKREALFWGLVFRGLQKEGKV